MSKYVDEIVASIRNNPRDWKPYKASAWITGVQHKNIGVRVSGYGNTKLLSVINVYIDDLDVQTSYFDRWKLESASLWWFKNCGLADITGEVA